MRLLAGAAGKVGEVLTAENLGVAFGLRLSLAEETGRWQARAV